MLDPTIYMAKQLADLTEERPPRSSNLKHKSDSLKRGGAMKKKKKKDRHVTIEVDKNIKDATDSPVPMRSSKSKSRSVSMSHAQNVGLGEVQKGDGKAINRTPSNQSLSKMMQGGIKKVTYRLQVKSSVFLQSLTA